MVLNKAQGASLLRTDCAMAASKGFDAEIN